MSDLRIIINKIFLKSFDTTVIRNTKIHKQLIVSFLFHQPFLKIFHKLMT